METQEAPLGLGEEETPTVEIGALFASDLEPERLDVPGWPGCWVELRAMDADTYARYLSTGQKVSVRGDRFAASEASVDVQTDRAAQELFLLQHTVADFLFIRKKRATNGEETAEETRLAAIPPQRKIEFKLATFRTMTPAFRAWLVGECQRVNGLNTADLGN